MQSDKQNNEANILMLTNVLRILPAAHHHAWICTSGPNGYCAVKEMLQNGIPGNILLIESDDVRAMESSESHCCLVYSADDCRNVDFQTSRQLPRTTKHVIIYSNMAYVPQCLLSECTSLTSLDLSPLSHITTIQRYFLDGCIGLTALDLSPFSQVTEVQGYFLKGCSGLTAIDLTPLSQVREVYDGFLERCTGLTALDLSPLSQMTELDWGFLGGCTGLTAVDLTPLSRVTLVQPGFIYECSQITAIDNIPPLCVHPPHGWVLKMKTNQWVRIGV